jgi:ubiquinone/menaquinone biosynthesis C-methylase UbiE
MFKKSARFYDAIYAFKDYEAEARQVHDLIQEHMSSEGMTLLDVGCGTGGHIGFLRTHYEVEGLDLDPGMLAIARERYPEVPFHCADMADFDLGHPFDVVTCLFSSIGYVKTAARLRQTLRTMTRHVNPGGLIIVEPWFAPDVFFEGRLSALFIDEPDLKIARMNISKIENDVSILDFRYLIGTPEGVDSLTERHELGLFTHDEYVDAFENAGLKVTHDAQGLTGRGLYIGKRPQG